MSTHVITDPAATRTPIHAPPSPAWLRLSAALTEEVPIIADRDDLIVDIAPGAGHGAPACFLPPHASIEIDGTHLGKIDPATVDPADPADRARYATVWGLFTHECAHAQHSRWDPPADAPAGAVSAAMLLEESRIESAHLRRRPDDRHWLRASARNLILADMPTTPGMTAPEAAQAAGLLLARTDAGILENDETTGLKWVIRHVLTTDTLATLSGIWRSAHAVADDDAEAMIELGRRWCEAVGTDPYTTPPDSSSGSGSTDSGARGTRSPLASEVRRTVDEVARHAARETPPDGGAARAASAAVEQATATQSQQISKDVFGDGGNGHSRTGTTIISGRRAPTPAERRAARTLARALNTAGTTERHATRTTSPVPPGRLRMRGALAADAQRAAGRMPTAEPFTRTTRKTAPAPPLRIGIACDTSDSMGRYTAEVASAAWILAQATRHTSTPAESATVIFNRTVLPITYPGTAPGRVTDFTTSGSDENLPRAIHSLDGALGLARPGAARLLVIISDGRFHRYAADDGQRLLDRLRATGCAVLWLTTGSEPTPLTGATVHHLSDPATTATVIGRAATTALRHAAR
ncbi:hypothetical protein GCM10027271_42580 [Saccharopolyspora gloriosae]|uniref:VWA domain containing CoxE-like protein n=1 Tax=Saccharopolyspora gloriosae TaxID=455344 RepID=A0A840NDM6_9PSEU|nr:hypothetical protein [Saccharopolyspora gloriosae]MBB5070446.1 hypothetical protein [Saccharopolyspora gloriosae]